MKKSDIKYDEIVSYDVLDKNYKDICRSTKHREKILKFDLFYSINMNNIYNDIKNRNYKHSKYNIFLIREPKYRIVMSECFRDKIVNHVVSNKILKPVLYRKLIEENVATRIGKGTNAAIEYCKKYFVRMMNNHEEFYILKFDISKYFYNIDHEILKKKLKNIYTDSDIIDILFEIIDSTYHEYINRDIQNVIKNEIDRLSITERLEARKRIEELKKIPYYKKGKGLGIGSLSSQILAIFYLNELDHYIKENLRIKEYIRFMDDGILFSEDKSKLKIAKREIERILDSLKLTLNDKTQMYTSKTGFEFVGYRFQCKNGKLLIKIKNDTKKRIKKKFKVLEKYDAEKLIRVKASYKGLIQYCTTNSFFKKYFDE